MHVLSQRVQFQVPPQSASYHGSQDNSSHAEESHPLIEFHLSRVKISMFQSSQTVHQISVNSFKLSKMFATLTYVTAFA